MMIYAAFMIGLLGSLHCLGMCGPIAFALPVRTTNTWIKLFKYLLYNFGRVATYSCMGLMVGVVGEGFEIAGLQQIISIATGIIIILSVLLIYNPFNNRFFTGLTSTVKNKLKSTFKIYFKDTSLSSLFILGVLNGLLPCGMVYMAVLGALATGDSLSGAAFMAAFGLGTVPLMLFVSLTGSMVSTKMKTFFYKASPILGCIVGVMLIVRGLNWEATSVSDGKNSCCKVEKCH